MKKIISLFQRNYDGNRLVRNEVVPGAEWVLQGEGVAYQKYDGTCCLIQNGILYKRYDAKRGKQPPPGFLPAQEPDEKTGHWPGWLKVDANLPENKWFVEGFKNWLGTNEDGVDASLELVVQGKCDGTYELVGPKINGNPESIDRHCLVPHDLTPLPDCPRTFLELKEFFRTAGIEGIVWHHPDGRMVKIKAKDFGLVRVS